MNNFLQTGEQITWTNGTGSTVASGKPVVVGMQQMGIAAGDIANGAAGTVFLDGVFLLVKNTSQAITLGQKLWWDATNEYVINAPVINSYFLGYAHSAQLAADTTVHVEIEEFCYESARVLTLAATGAQTLNVGDFAGGNLIVFAPNTAAQTVNLPSVTAIPPGAKLFMKKSDATAQAVTLDPASGETIAGGATFATIDANNDLAQFVSTGAAWALMHSTIA